MQNLLVANKTIAKGLTLSRTLLALRQAKTTCDVKGKKAIREKGRGRKKKEEGTEEIIERRKKEEGEELKRKEEAGGRRRRRTERSRNFHLCYL